MHVVLELSWSTPTALEQRAKPYTHSCTYLAQYTPLYALHYDSFYATLSQFRARHAGHDMCMRLLSRNIEMSLSRTMVICVCTYSRLTVAPSPPIIVMNAFHLLEQRERDS